MITTLPPYPAYKDSGVPWLGQVPEHWEVRKLRALFTKAGSGTTPSGEEFYGGDIPWVVTGDLNDSVLTNTTSAVNARALETFSALRLYPKDSLIVAMYGATIGKTAILGIEACTNQACCVLAEPRRGVLVRFIQSAVIAAKGYLVRQGYGGGQPNINSEIVHSLRIPVPPCREQTAIVRFLDYMDRRIRRFIRANQKLIKLLEEYRQALIHQAVTGKIDVRTGQPYPSYKDSGVPWLGKVPEHWEVQCLKTICTMKAGENITNQSIEPSGEFPVYGGNGIRGYTSRFTHEGEFIVIGRQGALCGNVHLVDGRFWASEHAIVVSPYSSYNLQWFAALLEAMNLNQYSMAAAQPGLAVERVRNLWAPVPPYEEQRNIAEHTTCVTSWIDAAIAAARREIELLREYRERLIADVVTGKVDVRQVAAQLPDEPPDQEAGTEEEEPVAEELATVDSQEESNGEE
jgi:type I restriction enzyme S subunit